MKIPKSAPTLQRMNNGLNQPDAEETWADFGIALGGSGDGFIGNVSIYNHALSPQQVQRLYTQLYTDYLQSLRDQPPRAALHGVTP